MEDTNLLRVYEAKMKPFRDIRQCSFNSHNFYHGGLTEDIYEEGLKWELEQLGYVVCQQEEFHISYKGHELDKTKRMDLVVKTESVGNIVLELKALNAIDDKQRHQLFGYLRLLNWKYGMLINFSLNGVYTEIWEYINDKNKFERVII